MNNILRILEEEKMLKIKMNKKYISIILVMIFIATSILYILVPYVSNAATYNQVVKSGVSDFPVVYQDALNKLKAMHPNWNFVAYYTGIDWNELTSSRAENSCMTNTIFVKNVVDSSWLCTCKRVGDKGYQCASKKIVDYYLDPRNFLTEITVFQFLDLSYDSNITKDNVTTAVSNTFLSGSVEVNGITYTYVDIIMEAAEKYKVNPLHIVVTILQELGTGRNDDGTYFTPVAVSGTKPGYEGLYNFFNYGATDGIDNGLTATEKGLLKAAGLGWTDPKTALIEGTGEALSNGYMSKGQITKYFYKFDVVGNSILKPGESVTLQNNSLFYTHQYMTNVQDPNNQAKLLYNRYASSGLIENNLTFVIPVYNNMPDYVKLPTTLTQGDGDLYYVSSNYDEVGVRSGPGTNHTRITGLRKDTVVVMLEYNINGSNWSKIRLQDGTEGYMSNTYLTKCYTTKIQVDQSAEFVIDNDMVKMTPTVKIQDIKNKYTNAIIKDAKGVEIIDNTANIGTGYTIAIDTNVYTAVKIGDINGDGESDARDSSRILRYSIGAYQISGVYEKASDISKDGAIDARDSSRILKYSIGEFKVEL